MKNERIDLDKDPDSPADARIYRLVGILGDLQERLLRKVKAPVWRSFNGHVYTSKTMNDRHLHNVIEMCLRNQRDAGEPLPPAFEAFVAERDRRNAEHARLTVLNRIARAERAAARANASEAVERGYDAARANASEAVERGYDAARANASVYAKPKTVTELFHSVFEDNIRDMDDEEGPDDN